MLPRRYRTYGLNTNKQKQLRNLSRNGIVRRGIERIKKGVLSLTYELKSKDNSKITEQKKLIINTIIKNPNIVHDYKSFFDMILEDVLTFDAGVFNKVKGGNSNRPLFLYPIDGTTIDILQPYDYTNPDGDMYVQKIGLLNERTYSIREIAYLQINHFTDTPYGLSAVEKLYRYLNYFLDALDNAADIASIDTPKFMIALKGVEANKLKEFREYMANEIEGSGHIPIVGGEVDSAQIGAINADSLFIEWQKFLLTLVAKCFDLPESFFISNDVNDRNTIEEVQQQVIIEAIKPYADLIEKAINLHIIQELGIYDIEFKFIYAETETQKKLKTDRVISMVSSDLLTLDEARVELGKEPLNSKYSKYTITEAKARINEAHQINGFGNAKDTSGNKESKTKNTE
jgi:phage portal protein BeeE